jgi:Cu-Zn family superoxide dismutase
MTRLLTRMCITLIVGGISACLSLPAAAQQPLTAAAEIKDTSGRTIATAELKEDTGKVSVSILIPTPSPLSGKHGIHVMDTGRCDPPDFVSAGAIFNPFGKNHGLLAQGGPMVGDLPNLAMPLQRYNAPAIGGTLGPGPASLLGPRGASLVIFAREDDGVTAPEGNAGARIGCGVISTSGQTASAAPLPAASQAAAPSPDAGQTLGPALLIVGLGAGLIGLGLALRRR